MYVCTKKIEKTDDGFLLEVELVSLNEGSTTNLTLGKFLLEEVAEKVWGEFMKVVQEDISDPISVSRIEIFVEVCQKKFPV